MCGFDPVTVLLTGYYVGLFVWLVYSDTVLLILQDLFYYLKRILFLFHVGSLVCLDMTFLLEDFFL